LLSSNRISINLLAVNPGCSPSCILHLVILGLIKPVAIVV
jgi:hypothetical protein